MSTPTISITVPPTSCTDRWVVAQPARCAFGARPPGSDEHEGDPQPDRVEDGEQHTTRHRTALVSERHSRDKDRAVHRTDARTHPETEHHAQQRCAEQPGGGTPADWQTALSDEAQIDQRQQDDGDAADPGDQTQVVPSDVQGPAERYGNPDQHDAETEHEEQRSRHQPGAAAFVSEPGDVREEPGHQGQDARGCEGDQTCHEGKPHRERQAAGGDDLLHVGGHPRHLPDSVSSTRPTSVVVSTGPVTRAATRCWASSTRVAGGPLRKLPPSAAIA